MLKKNGMLPKDIFHETYKMIENHSEELKKKSRKVREQLLSSEDFFLPEAPNKNGDSIEKEEQ